MHSARREGHWRSMIGDDEVSNSRLSKGRCAIRHLTCEMVEDGREVGGVIGRLPAKRPLSQRPISPPRLLQPSPLDCPKPLLPERWPQSGFTPALHSFPSQLLPPSRPGNRVGCFCRADGLRSPQPILPSRRPASSRKSPAKKSCTRPKESHFSVYDIQISP